MTNTLEAAEWALNEQGANSLEVDLRFDGDGFPVRFFHGGFCDCVCSHHCLASPERNVGRPDTCAPIGCDCGASASAALLLSALALQPNLALLVIDSKVYGSMGESTLTNAGRAVVSLLSEHLFGNGFAGNVIVSCAQPDAFTFLQAAAVAVKSGSYADRTFLGFDQLGGNTSDAVCGLDLVSRLGTRAISFGTGITACLPGNFTKAIVAAVNSTVPTYIWTLDRISSMQDYLKLGVDGIMTNRPLLLRNLAVQRFGRRLAQPSDRLPLSSLEPMASGETANCGCDCDYRPGGCHVSYPAPRGKACKCDYLTLQWTCRGTVVECSDPASPFCVLPDASSESCVLGGGDCNGY